MAVIYVGDSHLKYFRTTKPSVVRFTRGARVEELVGDLSMAFNIQEKFFAKTMYDKKGKHFLYINIGIKHTFSCINIRQVPWEVLKTEAEDRGFQYLSRNLVNVNALKNYV